MGAGTIIFDEIDRGVGGAVASAIGERLARLASSRQLLAVTHSPQVAATGTHHFFIAKSSADGEEGGTVTRTGVHRMDADERRQEIARMLSGAEVTDEARAQAEKLLQWTCKYPNCLSDQWICLDEGPHSRGVGLGFGQNENGLRARPGAVGKLEEGISIARAGGCGGLRLSVRPMATFLWGMLSAATGCDLIPTYSYFRLYREGAR